MLQPSKTLVKTKFEKEQRAWDRLYRRQDYGAMGIQWRQQDAVVLLRQHLPEGSRMIDLGCGCGHACISAAEAGYQVVGIDFVEGMITQARENAGEAGLSGTCRFECMDLAEAHGTLGEFEGLLALGFVEYFEDGVAVLRSMRQLLSAGGLAVVQIWNRGPWADRVFATLYESWQRARQAPQIQQRAAVGAEKAARPPASPPAVEHRRYSPAEFTKMAESIGFRVLDLKGSLYFPHQFFGSDEDRSRWEGALQRAGARSRWIARRATNVTYALRNDLAQ